MNDRNRRSAAEVMANAARVVKAAVNIVRAAIAGGLHGAAAAAAKELLPTIISHHTPQYFVVWIQDVSSILQGSLRLRIRLEESEAFVDENTLTVNVNRLRKRLAAAGLEDFIATKFGVGYLIGD